MLACDEKEVIGLLISVFVCILSFATKVHSQPKAVALDVNPQCQFWHKNCGPDCLGLSSAETQMKHCVQMRYNFLVDKVSSWLCQPCVSVITSRTGNGNRNTEKQLKTCETVFTALATHWLRLCSDFLPHTPMLQHWKRSRLWIKHVESPSPHPTAALLRDTHGKPSCGPYSGPRQHVAISPSPNSLRWVPQWTCSCKMARLQQNIASRCKPCQQKKTVSSRLGTGSKDLPELSCARKPGPIEGPGAGRHAPISRGADRSNWFRASFSR